MIAKELFDAGQVTGAIQALSAYLRDYPADTTQRIFLFELLCFAGQYERAERQLSVLAQGAEAQLGAMLYYAALHAEKTRHKLFRDEAFPKESAQASTRSLSGTLNGKTFRSITDADPDIGRRLEVFAAGSYVWLPFEHIAAVRCGPPQRLRDSLWRPVYVRTSPGLSDKELGEVLLPAIYPFSWNHPDENVWLGRMTAWAEDDRGGEYPLGQKLLLVDNEEVPFLEIQSLEFAAGQAAAT